MYRLFIAVPVPLQIKTGLSELSLNIPGARWTDNDQLHVTIRFIGEVEGHLLKEIESALSEIRLDGFSMRFKGVGCFPTGNSPRVLWAGVEDITALTQLKNKIDASLSGLGIKREGRKFAPHVTLARLNKPLAGRIAQFMAAYSTYQSEYFRVEEYRLYSSMLLRKGAVHKIEAVYPLDLTVTTL